MKRNLINTSVSDEAFEIYKSLPSHGKGKYVSTAIVEKHQRTTGTDIQTQLDTLKQQVEALEQRMRKMEGREKG